MWTKVLALVLGLGLIFAAGWMYRDAIVPAGEFNIQAAIDAAAEGDTVQIPEGEYRETLVIGKSITLAGAGREITKLQNPGSEAVLCVVNDNAAVTLTGITFEQTGITDEAPATVCLNLLLVESARVDITDCEFVDAAFACVDVQGGGQLNLSGSKINGAKSYGVILREENTRGTILNCEIVSVEGPGIIVRDKAQLKVSDTKSWGNSGNGLVAYDDGTRVDAERCTFSFNAHSGIAILGGATAVLRENTCAANYRDGIRFAHTPPEFSASENRVEHNLGTGVKALAGAQGVVEDNVVEENNEGGVRSMGLGSRPLVTRNRVISNQAAGMIAGHCSTAQFQANILDRNDIGIEIVGFDSAPKIEGNTIRGSKHEGLRCSNDAGGTVRGNVFEQNTVPRLQVDDTSCSLTFADNHTTDGAAVVETRRDGAPQFAYYEGGADALLRNREFERLEAMATAFRTGPQRDRQGAWVLEAFYDDLGKDLLSGGSFEEGKALLDDWAKMYPESLTPKIALAGLYNGLAWKARGTGFSEEVTDAGWLEFREHLTEAKAVLDEAESLPVKDAALYSLRIYVLQGLQAPDTEMDEAMSKGAAITPNYAPLYGRRVFTLTKRWGGKPGEQEKLAEHVGELAGGGDAGDAMYAYAVAQTYIDETEDDFKEGRYDFEWARIERGWNILCAENPESSYYRSLFCKLAVLHGQKAVAKRLFDVIDGDWDRVAWSTFEDYEADEKWAAEA